MVVPVIIDAAGDARKTTAPVTSFVCPIRPSGIWASVRSWKAGSDSAGRVASVQMKVGATALTVMLCFAHSSAMQRVDAAELARGARHRASDLIEIGDVHLYGQCPAPHPCD